MTVGRVPGRRCHLSNGGAAGPCVADLTRKLTGHFRSMPASANVVQLRRGGDGSHGPTVAGYGMREPTEILPDEIANFLHGETRETRENSWSSFLARHNRLLLRVAHAAARNREDAMDAYAIVLEQLREHDGRRLRTYQADGRSKFTTWLVVVTRRICVDYLRQKYGRYEPTSNDAGNVNRSSRLALLQLVGADVDSAVIADDNAALPDAAVRTDELSARLEEAVRELGNDDRLLLKLRFHEDLSASAIARLIGSPTAFHVYRRLNGLLARLRGRLSERGIESAEP